MNKKKVKGLHSWSVFIPTIILIGILHLSIIITIVFINTNSNELAYTMTECANYTNDITSLLASTSRLSDTSSTFANNVEDKYNNGQINLMAADDSTLTYEQIEAKNNLKNSVFGALRAYITEMSNPLMPQELKEKINTYKITDEVKTLVNSAYDSTDYMMKMQQKAIYLVKYSLDNISSSIIPKDLDFSKIPVYELTQDEKNLTNEKRINMATGIFVDYTYTKSKSLVSTNITKSVNIVKTSAESKQESIKDTIKTLRALLWILTIIIVIIMLLFIFILLKFLILPIVSFGKKIQSDEFLDSNKSLYEANFLAASYNELLQKRNEFEKELQITAETDALTGLPNRYSYNEFLKKDITNGISVCIFQFDINNLKMTNDTYGHDKGDELIMNSSKCIKECFLEISENKCYRLGGDEFIAIVNNIKFEDIIKYVNKFNETQKKYNVSIAIGYEYVDDISTTNYENLAIKADQKMYEDKNNKKHIQ